MRKIALLLVAAWMLAAASAPACSLCGGASKSTSLVYEFENAQVIAYGRLANPKLGSVVGQGTTEFHIDKLVKDASGFPRDKMFVLPRYLPVIDPKQEPKYVMFFRSGKQGFQWYWGKQLPSAAVIDFIAEVQRLKTEPAKMLLYAAKHFDHADPLVADEAFLLFARADDKLVAQTAGKLSPQTLRKLVKDPETEPIRLSMFAYLLGACGNDDDAEVLRTMLKKQSPRHYDAFEGILAGYITMRPKDGWKFAHEVLTNPKEQVLFRFSTLRTLRFFYNANPQEAGPRVMEAMAAVIVQTNEMGFADIADIAIDDLRAWKRWEHTKLILSCWDKKSHSSGITRQNIVYYALQCPEPEARTFIERARRQDRELVERMEAALK